jgi:hypothetical protein
MNRFTAPLLTGVAALLVSVPAVAQRPANGNDVLGLMRNKYKDWYQTLEFRQTTTLFRGDSSRQETWYETLQYLPGSGAHLRIDSGNPKEGNGTVSTWDSTWSMRAGHLASASANGNPFLGLIENVYLQPPATTAHQLEPLQFDMSRVTDGSWESRPVWIVGAASTADSMLPQFWVDKERLVVVRMLISTGPNRPPLDIQLSNYVETGGGWLATKVSMFSNKKPRQLEEYFDWKTRMPVDRKLFDPATWGSGEHWVK